MKRPPPSSTLFPYPTPSRPPAVQEITRRGGWVVRLGDPTMEPFPPTPAVIDYAHSRLKSPATDVFLCGACRFFIGVASGRSEEHTSELQSPCNLVCRLLLAK